jgi:hypothetical protein
MCQLEKNAIVRDEHEVSPKTSGEPLNYWASKHKDASMHKKESAPWNDPNFFLMDVWLESEGYDQDPEECSYDFQDLAKEEYSLRGERMRLKEKRTELIAQWRKAHCHPERRPSLEEAFCVAHSIPRESFTFEKEYEKTNDELKTMALQEQQARRNRLASESCICCIPGFSCLALESPVLQVLQLVRSNPYWQWMMLITNLVNVVALMTSETDPVKIRLQLYVHGALICMMRIRWH